MQIGDEIAATFTDLRMKRSYRYIIFKISEDGNTAEVQKAGARDETFAQFKEQMPVDQPRYAVYDLEFKTEDGRAESKVVFIMYSPDNCTNSQLRFVYANNKDAIK